MGCRQIKQTGLKEIYRIWNWSTGDGTGILDESALQKGKQSRFKFDVGKSRRHARRKSTGSEAETQTVELGLLWRVSLAESKPNLVGLKCGQIRLAGRKFQKTWSWNTDETVELGLYHGQVRLVRRKFPQDLNLSVTNLVQLETGQVLFNYFILQKEAINSFSELV